MEKFDLIVDEYDKNVSLYVRLCERIRFILEDSIQKEGLYIHSIHSRTKSRQSLVKKIHRPDVAYKELKDITDIAGLRVTTYFSSDVDKVAEIVERKFTIDHENSIDKREITDPDRFGYLSLHYVVNLLPCDMIRPDHKLLEGLKAEIQIRSILQHAWAEIEHDLGYKSKYSIPFKLRRRFSRLSGLLELADEEFNNLRRDLNEYKSSIEQAEYIDKYIDKISLANFIRRSDLVKGIDNDISKRAGIPLEYEEWFIESLVEKLKFVKINDFEKLMILLGRRSDVVARIAENHLKSRSYSRINNGVCIYYFCTSLLAEWGNESKLIAYLKKFKLGNSETRQQFAEKIISKYRMIANSFNSK